MSFRPRNALAETHIHNENAFSSGRVGGIPPAKSFGGGGSSSGKSRHALGDIGNSNTRSGGAGKPAMKPSGGGGSSFASAPRLKPQQQQRTRRANPNSSKISRKEALALELAGGVIYKDQPQAEDNATESMPSLNFNFDEDVTDIADGLEELLLSTRADPIIAHRIRGALKTAELDNPSLEKMRRMSDYNEHDVLDMLGDFEFDVDGITSDIGGNGNGNTHDDLGLSFDLDDEPLTFDF